MIANNSAENSREKICTEYYAEIWLTKCAVTCSKITYSAFIFKDVAEPYQKLNWDTCLLYLA